MATHGLIKDDGLRFQIVPTTRKVTVPPAYVVVGTVGDHNSEQLTFQCPKVIDGHDVVHCSDHYVIWKNVLGETGRSEITNITTDDENMYFTWTISSGVTAAAGFIAFTIHFEDTDISGAIAYKWSTTTCNDCQVLDTIKVVTDSGEDSEETDNTYIPDGYVRPSGTLDINKNGEYDVMGYQKARVNAADNVTLHPLAVSENGEYAPNTGYGYSKVSVDVQAVLQEKTVTENGTVVPDSGFDGLSSVTVDVPQPKDTYAISMNGEYYIRDYEKVLVQIDDGDSEDEEDEELNYQDLTVTENGIYTPDEGYDAISSVTVDVLGGDCEPGDGIDITDKGVISVKVDGETVKINSQGQLEGFTSIFNNAIVFPDEGAVNVFGTTHTVEYVDGNRVTYGAPYDSIVVGGYICYSYAGTAPNGVLLGANITTANTNELPDIPMYTDFRFPDTPCYNSALVAFNTRVGFDLVGVYASYLTLRDVWTNADNTQGTGDVYKNYSGYDDYGIAVLWDSFILPGESVNGTPFPYGGIKGRLAHRSKSSATEYKYNVGPVYHHLPFNSEAEYNAAIGLTYETKE